MVHMAAIWTLTYTSIGEKGKSHVIKKREQNLEKV